MSTATAEYEASTLRHLCDRLAAADDPASPAEIAAAVERAVRRFTNAPIREYVPLLVERLVTDELRHRRPTGDRMAVA
jgi:hypothetical protein